MIRRGVVPVAALFVLLVMGPAQAGTCQIGGFNPHETVGQFPGEMIAVQGLGFSSVAGVIVELRAPGDEAIIGVLPFVEDIAGTKHQGIVTIPVDYPPGEWEISLQGDLCEALSTYVVLEPLNTELAPVDATDDDPTVATFAGPASPPTSTAVGEVVPTVPVPTSVVGPPPVTDDDLSPVLLVLLGGVLGAGLLGVGIYLGRAGTTSRAWAVAAATSLTVVLGLSIYQFGGGGQGLGGSGCSTCEIVFSSNLNGPGFEIFVMDAGGGNLTQLTADAAWKYSPDWSPDGSKIAYERWFGPSDGIWVMDADGGSQAVLTNETYDGQPDWSPDGSRIAFRRNQDANMPPSFPLSMGIYEIFVMDADGSNQTNLTMNAAGDLDPAWSPDGSKIAFTSNRDGLNEGGHGWDVYVMDADGGNPTRLTTHSFLDRYPAWSPDGSKIAFSTEEDGFGGIWVMDADGANQTVLTTLSYDFTQAPAWSRDGSKLAFHTQRDGNFEIYVMDADGSNQTRLTFTTNSVDDFHPDWRSVGSDDVIITGPGDEDTFPTSSVTIPEVIPTLIPTSIVLPPPVTDTVADDPADSIPACQPAVPVLLRPPDESLVTEASPLLEWAYRSGQPCELSGQLVDLAMDPDFVGDVMTSEVAPEAARFSPEILADCTMYYWRVAPVVDGVTGPHSDVSSFSTDFPKAVGCP